MSKLSIGELINRRETRRNLSGSITVDSKDSEVVTGPSFCENDP